ncbi:MAG: hypothetical protein KAU23_06085, partial [Anaerolineales bacterium]|nr:hypothetical protein [Anaerolineales bacterium]
MVPQIFPSLKVTREQIVFQFSGVRPLPVAKGNTGQISRDHSIEVLEKSPQAAWPILNLVGGKWTSYRALSEQVTDQVLGRLNQVRQASTSRLPIGGGKDYPADADKQQTWLKNITTKSGIPLERIEQLFTRYGTRTAEIADFLSKKSNPPLKHLSEYTRGEITYLVEHEMVTHLDDFLIRRTKLAWLGCLSKDLLIEAAGVIGEELNWSDTKKGQEINRTCEILEKHHSVVL